MGRTRKPIDQHEVDGTYRADRHAAQAESEPRSENPPVLPVGLTDAERAVWDRVISYAPWLREPDSNTLRNYCALQVEFEDDSQGMPAARIAICVKLGAELGLTPAGRARIGAATQPAKPKSDADQFFH